MQPYQQLRSPSLTTQGLKSSVTPKGGRTSFPEALKQEHGWQDWCLPVSGSYFSLEYVVHLVLIFPGEVYGLCVGEDLNDSTLYQTLNLGKSMPQLLPLCYIWRVWGEDCINS